MSSFLIFCAGDCDVCMHTGMGQLHCSQLQLNYKYITFHQLQLQVISVRPITITKWSVTITITCPCVRFASHNWKRPLL